MKNVGFGCKIGGKIANVLPDSFENLEFLHRSVSTMHAQNSHGICKDYTENTTADHKLIKHKMIWH